MQIIFFFYFLWDHWVHSGFFENRILLKPLLKDEAYAALQTILFYMKRLNKSNLWFSFFRMFFVSKVTFRLFITKTRLYSFGPLKPQFYTVNLGFIGVYRGIHLFNLLISAHNIGFGYSLELPHLGGSNVSRIYVLSWNFYIFHILYKLPELSIWKFSFFGIKY